MDAPTDAPAPAPAAATPPAPARLLLEDHLIWNAFAEEFGARYRPAPELKADTVYTLRVHLAALSYATDDKGVYTHASSKSTRKVVREWLTSMKDEEELTAVLLYDDRFFRDPAESVKTVKVRVDRMRAFDEGKVELPRNPLAQLRQDDAAAPFVFVAMEFKLETREELPAESVPVAVSIWYRDKPVEEISVAFCAAGTKECDGPQGVQFGLGLDAARVAAGPAAARSAAALHLVDLSRDVGVVFRSFHAETGAPEALATWTLGKPPATAVQDVRNILGQLGKAHTDAGIRAEGIALHRTLFPKTAAAAEKTFSDFVRSRVAGRGPFESADLPAIFVRPRFGEAAPPALLPFAMMAVPIGDGGPVFLGHHFRVQGPLKLQDYGGASACISAWKVVGPPPAGDAALVAARGRLNIERRDGKPGVAIAGGHAPIIEDMQEFLDWVATGQSPSGTLLSILSHHDSDHVRFAGDPRVHAAVVRRDFLQPSVALLNGCSTGQAGAGATSFVEALNQQGFQAAIATMTEVSGDLAGDFLECFAAQVTTAPEGIELGKAYLGALKCVAIDKKHGAKALWYVLLGDSELRICAPRP